MKFAATNLSLELVRHISGKTIDCKTISTIKKGFQRCQFCRKIIKKLSGKPNPAIYLRGIEHKDIQNILEFMYVGEVNVAQEDLDSFLAAAQDLCIKGLTTTQENSQAKPARLSEPKSDRIQPPPPKRSKILPKPENHDIKKKSFDVVKQEPQVAGNNHQQPSEDLDTYDDYYEADTMEDNLGEDDSKGEAFLKIQLRQTRVEG